MTQGRTEIPYLCIGCGVSGVKLWREYQTFLDHQSLKCKACSEEEQAPALERRKESAFGTIETDTIGWRVPAVPDDTGTFWGYTSVPQDRVDWWNALPEENVMDEEEPLVELTVELYDENGDIANVSLPAVQPEVTLAIYAKQKGSRRKLQVLLEVDDDGQPKFTILNPKDIA